MNDPRVYFLKALRSKAVKIGTSSDFTQRIASLRAQYGGRLALIGTVPGDERYERTLHKAFADYRIRGEWFRCEGRLSSFISSLPFLPEDIRPPSKRRVFDGDRRRPTHEEVDAIHKRQLAVYRQIITVYGVRRFALVNGFKPRAIDEALKGRRVVSVAISRAAYDLASDEQRSVLDEIFKDGVALGMETVSESDEDRDARRHLAKMRGAVLERMGEGQLMALEERVLNPDSDGVLAIMKHRVVRHFGAAGEAFVDEFENCFPPIVKPSREP